MMVLLALLACVPDSSSKPEPTTPPMTLPEPTEAERHVRGLSNRHPADRQAPHRTWLLEHPAEALPPLIAAVDAREGQTKAAIEVLGQLGRPEGVAPLTRVLSAGDELYVHAAALALARTPSEEAAQALVGALDGPPASRRAALVGLGERGDPEACEAVRLWLNADDEGTRVRAVSAAVRLACLAEAELEALRNDPSDEVRAALAGH